RLEIDGQRSDVHAAPTECGHAWRATGSVLPVELWVLPWGNGRRDRSDAFRRHLCFGLQRGRLAFGGQWDDVDQHSPVQHVDFDVRLRRRPERVRTCDDAGWAYTDVPDLG